jgi:hypothetical protein
MDTTTYPEARSGIEYAEFGLSWLGSLIFGAGIIMNSAWATALGFFMALIAVWVGLRPD